MLAWRFSDGAIVSISEFLYYFTTPDSIRQAKAAAATVRMSLDLLNLDLPESSSPDENTVRYFLRDAH